jgi:hypothetical protein
MFPPDFIHYNLSTMGDIDTRDTYVLAEILSFLKLSPRYGDLHQTECLTG